MRRKKMSRRVVGLYSNLKNRPVKEQIERLRTGPQYRDPEFVHAYLGYLDDWRYGKPAEAARLAAAIGNHVVPELRVGSRERLTLLAHSLGVFASAHRVQGTLGLGGWAISLALRSADDVPVSDVASLLQRACHVVVDHGEYEEAETLAGKAVELYTKVADLEGMAKAIVDRATVMRRLGRLEESQTSNLMALSLLPPDERRYRAAAQFNLGLVYREQNRLEDAIRRFEQARRLLPAHNLVWHAILAWRHGDILAELHDFDGAITRYREAQANMSRINPYDTALISLSLIKCLLRLGDGKEASSIARSMMALLTPLKGNKFASGAILELIRSALAGEVTEAAIDRTRDLLERYQDRKQ